LTGAGRSKTKAAKSGHDGAMFTLAHLSDPHLAPLPPPRPKQLLNKRLTGFINWHRNRKQIHDPQTLGRIVAGLKTAQPDHIAATGDFTNIALPGEFERARRWLETLGDARDVTAIPGNHDIYVPGSLNAMQAALGPYMHGDDNGGRFPFVRRRGPVALVAVNTGVLTAPFQATGLVGEPQLAGLRTVLERLKTEGLFRAVLIHHPPISPRPRDKILLDGPALLRVIAEHGAELIVHGHDHVNALVWLDGPDGRVPAIGVPSASAKPGTSKGDAGYNLYRIDGKPGAWRCEVESHGITASGEIATVRRMQLYG
jgi:3',5'-cyclic AMP phosphodiesterase CpdA